jgi:hypothetical protein
LFAVLSASRVPGRTGGDSASHATETTAVRLRELFAITVGMTKLYKISQIK